MSGLWWEELCTGEKTTQIILRFGKSGSGLQGLEKSEKFLVLNPVVDPNSSHIGRYIICIIQLADI